MSGTACSTLVLDEGEPITMLYRLYDGYLEGHGKELVSFLKNIKLVNGIGLSDKRVANGMDCLAAQIIAHFKQRPGDFYLSHPDADPEDFHYVVYNKKNTINIKILYEKKVLYDGSVSKCKIKGIK